MLKISRFIFLVFMTFAFMAFCNAYAKPKHQHFTARDIDKVVVYFVGWGFEYNSVPSDADIKALAVSKIVDYNKRGGLFVFLSRLNSLSCRVAKNHDNGIVGAPAMIAYIYGGRASLQTIVISQYGILIKSSFQEPQLCNYDAEFVKSLLVPMP